MSSISYWSTNLILAFLLSNLWEKSEIAFPLKKKIKISGSPGQNVWIKFQLSIIAGLEVLKKYKSWLLKVSYVRNNKLEDYPLVHTRPKIILFLENYHPKIITNMFITFPNWGSLWFSETTVNEVYGFWTAKWNK